MLNHDAGHTILSILQATLIGISIGWIIAAINYEQTYQVQLEYERSFYLSSYLYYSLLGASLGCTLGVIKANIKEYKSDRDQEIAESK